MARLSSILAIVLSISISGIAQSQIGTVTSSAPFQLRGTSVTPDSGVPNWPLLPGDTIQAGADTVLITFLDGSSIVLSSHATATIAWLDDTPVFNLIDGSAYYRLNTPTSVKLQCTGTESSPKNLEGESECGGRKLAAGWWFGAGVAGGVVAGIALSQNNGDEVSPSR
jgi:hypothetical protein